MAQEDNTKAEDQGENKEPPPLPDETNEQTDKSPGDSNAAAITIEEWLESLKLSKHVQLFVDNEIDLEAAYLLTENDLTEMGLPIGPRKRLLYATGRISNPVDHPPSPSSQTSVDPLPIDQDDNSKQGDGTRTPELPSVSLTPADVQKAEELANWQFVEARNKIVEIREHVARFPSGVTEKFAQARLEELAWVQLERPVTIEIIKSFLDEFPDGDRADDARKILDALIMADNRIRSLGLNVEEIDGLENDEEYDEVEAPDRLEWGDEKNIPSFLRDRLPSKEQYSGEANSDEQETLYEIQDGSSADIASADINEQNIDDTDAELEPAAHSQKPPPLPDDKSDIDEQGGIRTSEVLRDQEAAGSESRPQSAWTRLNILTERKPPDWQRAFMRTSPAVLIGTMVLAISTIVLLRNYTQQESESKSAEVLVPKNDIAPKETHTKLPDAASQKKNKSDVSRTAEAVQQLGSLFGDCLVNSSKEDCEALLAHTETTDEQRTSIKKGLHSGFGQQFKDCDSCPQMIVIPSGSFRMGSDRGQDDEKPIRRVVFAKPIAIGKFEVTFAEWDTCVIAGGCIQRPDDAGWGRGDRPVINVSWMAIVGEYLPWLSEKTGKAYRLLTEAEWEYAARARTITAFSWGADVGTGKANCAGCGPRWALRTAPVGSFVPNGFGLHDMHGGVWEWVQDCYEKNYEDAPIDGSAVLTGNCHRRVLRGGSWSDYPNSIRSSHRGKTIPQARANHNGFRVAWTIGRKIGPATKAWSEIKHSTNPADFRRFRAQHGRNNPFLDRLAVTKLASYAMRGGPTSDRRQSEEPSSVIKSSPTKSDLFVDTLP